LGENRNGFGGCSGKKEKEYKYYCLKLKVYLYCGLFAHIKHIKMELNNTCFALDIMRIATSELNRINYNSIAFWAEDLTAVRNQLYKTIEAIEAELNQSKDDE
jgi:hypothetical protein